MHSPFKMPGAGVLAACFVFAAVLTSSATTVEKMNIARLIEHGELILVGQVTTITDGFGTNGLPYTEITLEVGETIKGNVGGIYTFRQFGLVEPRELPDGKVYLGVSPDGWPRFEVDEEVLVFLYPTTALGFQSAVGLLQGKFNIANQQVFNALDNLGLFEDVSVDQSLLTRSERKMLGTSRGRYPAATFKSFLRKAIKEDWFAPGDASTNDRKERDAEEDRR